MLPRFRWKYLIAPYLRLDWLLLVLSVGITGFGGMVIRSAELSQGLTGGGNGFLVALVWR